MTRFAPISLAVVAALALAACGKPAAPTNESDTVPLPAPGSTQPGAAPPAAAPAASAPAKPSGPAESITALDEEGTQWAASVTEVVWLPDYNLKLFSTAGGDPAINGLYTHIAFPPENNGDDWKVFRIGDFESWTVAEKGPGRVVLDVRVSRIDPSSGDPVTEAKKLIVNFTGGESPTVTVTPGT